MGEFLIGLCVSAYVLLSAKFLHNVTAKVNVFENVASRNIIAYVKDINFCNRI